MTLALELAGAFLGGWVAAMLLVLVGARRALRKAGIPLSMIRALAKPVPLNPELRPKP